MSAVNTVERLKLLSEESLEIVGLLQGASNGTFLAKLGDGDDLAVYKPQRFERPLWDFPPGLDRREVAAFVLCDELGWEFVPATVLREGPTGQGSVQWFEQVDLEQHYFTLMEQVEHRLALEKMCLFDLIANNTDRKSGHCLLTNDGRIVGIDHGLCFASEFKVRTVIWDFASQAIPESLLTDIARVHDSLPVALTELLDEPEAEALLERMNIVTQLEVFPEDSSGRRYPWPLI